jgi:site-specific recombinase XerD
MQHQILQVRFFLKKQRPKMDGTLFIYARIRLSRQNKLELTTNQSVLPQQWDDKKGVVVNHPDVNIMNKYLEAFKGNINNAFSQLYIAKQPITLEAIKALLMGESAIKQFGLLEVAEEHNANFETMVGIKYSYGSYKNYKTTLKFLKEFVPLYFKKADIPLPQVNYKFCEAYFKFLTTKKTSHVNGANKHIQRLRKLMNYAIKHEYIQTSPMASYSLEFEPVNKVALTIEEIQRIADVELMVPTMDHVRNIFLFQCYTGLSYSDVRLLTPMHISVGLNNTYWIHMKRQKTKVAFAIPLLSPALAIMQKYLPTSDNTSPIFPVLSNQKMNDNLKLIQSSAKISKRLTTHLGRHSFATTITLSNGVPMETVSRMLGHTKLSTTQIYAKVLETKIGSDMQTLSEKLNEKAQVKPSKKHKS